MAKDGNGNGWVRKAVVGGLIVFGGIAWNNNRDDHNTMETRVNKNELDNAKMKVTLDRVDRNVTTLLERN